MYIKGLHEKDIYQESFPFRLIENDFEDFEYPLHWHNATEILYVMENDIKVNINNKKRLVKEKDILYIAPGDIHGFLATKNKGIRFFIQFEPFKLGGLGIESIKPFKIETAVITKIEMPDIHAALEKQIAMLIDEYRQKSHAYQYALNARLFDVLTILSRSNLNKIYQDVPSKQTARIHGMEKLNKALAYMEDKYMEDISLKEAASIAGFSEYHFSRVFKDTMEKNFHSYLNELRIKKAEKLLSDPGYSISEIATLSGFNSFATFNRIFKEAKGCSPTMYRKYKSE